MTSLPRRSRRASARRAATIAATLAVVAVGCAKDPERVQATDATTTTRSPASTVPGSTGTSVGGSDLTVGPTSSTTTPRPAVETVPGMPPVVDPSNIYSEAASGKLSAATNGAQFLVYVPNEASGNLTVIDPRTYKVVATYPTGVIPQHVVPSYDMTKLYVLNNSSDTLTPIDPITGKPGKNISVHDPYNLYYTPDGSEAIIVEEADKNLAWVDPQTFAFHSRLKTDCEGINHIDYSIDGRYFIATCEFDGRLIKVDTLKKQVVGTLTIDVAPAGKQVPKNRAQPQDVRVANDGKVFYVADIRTDGVFLIDGESFTQIGYIKTGLGAHGLYPSRDGKQLYVVNRGVDFIPAVGSYKGKTKGSVTVIDFASRSVVATWDMPNGGSPDMGNLTPDGTELWMGGRYDAEVYVFDTVAGRLKHTIPAGLNPHGLTVWPQPGRYSKGHTGNVL